MELVEGGKKTHLFCNNSSNMWLQFCSMKTAKLDPSSYTMFSSSSFQLKINASRSTKDNDFLCSQMNSLTLIGRCFVTATTEE